MVKILSAILLTAAVSASASPAIPSFELSAAELQASVAAARASQTQARASDVDRRIEAVARELGRFDRVASRLRADLAPLLNRVRGYRPSAPNNDPDLRHDLQVFRQDLSYLARDSQWRLNDLRGLASQAGKDEALVAPAERLLGAARRFGGEASRLLTDARFAYPDFMRAGFAFEGADLDSDSRAVDSHAQDLEREAGRLLGKVRG
ncbi:MAG: hypothetical protein HY403_05650 [Elusimicrobia bacterium]|nr:hypothetical protein [Elusimicrobiota bacterium]